MRESKQVDESREDQLILIGGHISEKMLQWLVSEQTPSLLYSRYYLTSAEVAEFQQYKGRIVHLKPSNSHSSNTTG